jgi:hypothetical protein
LLIAATVIQIWDSISDVQNNLTGLTVALQAVNHLLTSMFYRPIH